MLCRAPHDSLATLALLLTLLPSLVSAEEVVPAATSAVSTAAPRRDGRFQNNYIDFVPRGFGALMKWKLDALREGLPPEAQTATPRLGPDLDFLRRNAAVGIAMEPAATWIGHASVLVQLGGISLLTDPVFSERASPVSFAGPRRQGPAGIAAVDLPRIDAVVISHNHYDHLDAASVKSLAVQPGGSPLFIVPLGVKAWFTDAGIDRVVELDWWQSRRVGEVEVVLVPAQHWSGRSFSDRMETLWGGYAVFAPDFHLFFAGDTGYSKDFADIHARFAARHGGAGRGFDLALLPIGAYEPRWFMKEQHIDPAEAVQIHLDLAARRSIGIHWGTFSLTDEALDEPPRALETARRQRGLADDAFTVMAIGETRRFPRRGP
jgi:N-acyl-phosphatidylethanolamine-hydrolysing phospholipase D